MADLSSTFYDAIADPDVHEIELPAGTFTIPTRFGRYSSDLDLYGADTILEATPTVAAWPSNDFYPLQIGGIRNVIVYDESPGGTDREIAHVTGTIVPGTTQLTVAPGDLALIGDLAPGETVMIWAGVTPSDPVEPHCHIKAQILAVNTMTGLITFASALDRTVPDYVNAANLEAATDPSLHWKIGDWGTWPSDANFSKGYGTDHGLERFQDGQMTSGVRFHDITLNLASNLVVATIPNGIWPLSIISAYDCHINGFNLTNPIGNAVHRWKCFDSTFNDCNFSGQGASKPFGGILGHAYLFTSWGGNGLAHNRIRAQGNDMVMYGGEVNTGQVTFDDVEIDVLYTSVRTWVTAPEIWGFNAVLDVPEIRDCKIKATTTGGSSHHYDTFSPVIYSGRLWHDNTSFTDFFDWGSDKELTFAGTLKVDATEYGPLTRVEGNQVIPHGAIYDVLIPYFVVPVARFRIITIGDLRDITDSFGTGYWSAASGGAWTAFEPDDWHQVPPGPTALNEYFGKYLRFWFNAGTAQNGVVEFDYGYMDLFVESASLSGVGAMSVGFSTHTKTVGY